jgi:malonyl-CoA O-methyltransferase
VFEFGCGTGRNLAALAAAGANPVRGCDLSEGMLSIARSKVPRADLFRHDFAQPLPDGLGEVDVALFSLTLEHADGLEHPLREARRILAPGGTVWIFEIHPFLSLSGVAAHFHDEGQEVRMPTYPHQFSNYLQAIASAGLRVVECREWRARDLDVPVPVKAVKRGPDFPMLVEFRLSTA